MTPALPVAIYSTFPDEAEERRIAHRLLEERLIACANIFPAGISIYRWQGETCEEPETVALFKTDATRQDAAMARLAALHSYDRPAVLAYATDASDSGYAGWIADALHPVQD